MTTEELMQMLTNGNTSGTSFPSQQSIPSMDNPIMQMFQQRQNGIDFQRQQNITDTGSFMGGRNKIGADGKVLLDINGMPIPEGGMNGGDMLSMFGGLAQAGLGFSQNQKQMELGRDNFRLKRRAYNDSREDAQRLRDVGRDYARGFQDEG